MKKICPICNNEYKFDWGQYFDKNDNTWYFCCSKCENEWKINTNRFTGKQTKNQEMYEKIFVEPFKKD